MARPLPDTRRQLLLDALERDGEAHVDTLAAALQVSPITVRRDIAELAAAGRLLRVRGGARRLPTPAPTALTAPAAPSPTGPAPSLAMVVPSLQYYWPTIVHSAMETAQRHGAELTVHATTPSAQANLLLLEQIAADDSIDALIIGPELRDGAISELLVQRLAELPIPVVLAERGLDEHSVLDRAFDTVRSDHSAGAALAVRHLAALGHRRLAYEGIASSPTNPFVEAGYERALTHLGLAEESAPASRLDLRPEHAFASIEAALERYRDQGVTGVLIHWDVAATMMLQHATRRGWTIPDELSLVTYDDELSVGSLPALTAVAPPKRTLGTRAVELALQRLRAPHTPIERVHLMPSLHVRNSTAAPR